MSATVTVTDDGVAATAGATTIGRRWRPRRDVARRDPAPVHLDPPLRAAERRGEEVEQVASKCAFGKCPELGGVIDDALVHDHKVLTAVPAFERLLVGPVPRHVRVQTSKRPGGLGDTVRPHATLPSCR
jgi:hypothetical protein